MRLIRWEPFRDFDELFERAVSPGRWPRLFGEKGVAYEWAPPADISETDREYLVKAELPGVKREDVSITLDDGVVSITGERKQENEEQDEKHHRIERFYRQVLSQLQPAGKRGRQGYPRREQGRSALRAHPEEQGREAQVGSDQSRVTRASVDAAALPAASVRRAIT